VAINANFGDTATVRGACGGVGGGEVCREYFGVVGGMGKGFPLSRKLGGCLGEQGGEEALPECPVGTGWSN
jgi:hypothetical protein